MAGEQGVCGECGRCGGKGAGVASAQICNGLHTHTHTHTHTAAPLQRDRLQQDLGKDADASRGSFSAERRTRQRQRRQDTGGVEGASKTTGATYETTPVCSSDLADDDPFAAMMALKLALKTEEVAEEVRTKLQRAGACAHAAAVAQLRGWAAAAGPGDYNHVTFLLSHVRSCAATETGRGGGGGRLAGCEAAGGRGSCRRRCPSRSRAPKTGQ